MQVLQNTLTAEQRLLLEGLQSHPKLMSRFLSILSLAEEPDVNGKIRSADEVESLLIEQVRSLERRVWKVGRAESILSLVSSPDRKTQALNYAKKNSKMVEYLWLD